MRIKLVKSYQMLRIEPISKSLRNSLKKKKTGMSGVFLVVKWLRLCTPKVVGPGSISGQGTRSHMLQLRVCVPQLKIPCVAIKTWPNKYIHLKKKIK